MSTLLLAPVLFAPLRLAVQLSLLSGRPLAEVGRSAGRLDQLRRAGRPARPSPEPEAAPAAEAAEPAPSSPDLDTGVGVGELERRIRAAAAELPRRRRPTEEAAAAPQARRAPTDGALPRRERPSVPAIAAAAAAGPPAAASPAASPARWADQVRRCLEARPDDALDEAAPRIERLVRRRTAAAYRRAADVLVGLRPDVPAERVDAFVADLRRRHPRKRALQAVLDERGFSAG